MNRSPSIQVSPRSRRAGGMIPRYTRLLLLLGLAIGAQPVRAQLQYDGTMFLHGLNDPNRWYTKDPISKLNQWVDLGPLGARIVTSTAPYAVHTVREQASALSSNELIFHQAIYVRINSLTSLLDAVVGLVLRDFNEDAVFNGIKKIANQYSPVATEGAQDLKVGSPTITRLSTTPDNKPHAAVYGTASKHHAAWRLVGTSRAQDDLGDRQVRKADAVKTISTACRVLLYNFILKTNTGRACHVVESALKQVDARWNYWTHDGQNLSEPFDRLLPRANTLYPGEPLGSTFNVRVDGQDHFTLVYTANGLYGVARGMLGIKMKPGTGAPPGGSTGGGGCYGCPVTQ